MGVRLASVSSTAIVSATLVTTAETVVVTTPPINLTVDNAVVLLFWAVQGVSGVGANGIVPRLRRGTALTGTIVNVNMNITISASSAFVSSGAYVDTPGIVSGQQYSMTLAQLGATGNATMNDVLMIAMVL